MNRRETSILTAYYKLWVTWRETVVTFSAVNELEFLQRGNCVFIFDDIIHVHVPPLLTGAVSELKAKVGASESVNGNGQFDDLTPSRAVVVIEHEGTVLWHVGLTWTQTDAILQVEGVQGYSSAIWSYIFVFILHCCKVASVSYTSICFQKLSSSRNPGRLRSYEWVNNS